MTMKELSKILARASVPFSFRIENRYDGGDDIPVDNVYVGTTTKVVIMSINGIDSVLVPEPEGKFKMDPLTEAINYWNFTSI